MKQKKVPLRTCVITKEKLPKKDLLRVVRTKEGNVEVDLTGKLNGHGAYIKKDKELIKKISKSRALEKHLETEIAPSVYEEIIRVIDEVKMKKNDDRPSWDEYFIKMSHLVATRSNCVSRKVGAVITVDNQVVTTGYNGAPKGLYHCIDCGGCLRKLNNIESGTRQEICRAVHAEQNAIISAAIKGVSIKGGTIYVNTYPCSICARMLINAEIKRIVYDSDYSDPLSKEMLEESKIELVKYEEK